MKTTKVALSTLLVSTIVLGGLVTSSVADAAKVQDYPTKGKVSFTERDGGTDPLDPEKPNIEEPVKPINPVDPTDPLPKPTGPLTIDYASSLDFGSTTKANAVDTQLNAQAQVLAGPTEAENTTHPNYVQVTDQRALNAAGKAQGWSLSAKMTKQFTSASNAELTGSTITYGNAAIEPEKSNTNKKPSTVATSTTLEFNKSVTDIIKANEGEGWGIWTYHFGTEATKASSVKLDVPASTMKNVVPDQVYKAEIVWTIGNLLP